MALDDLTRYESAAVAKQNVDSDKGLTVFAMENFYKGVLGKDINDPLIQRGLSEARQGLANAAKNGLEGDITSLGLFDAMINHSGKYEEAFKSTKFSDLTKYLTEGFKIEDEVKAALEKYADLTIEDLGKKAKEEEMSEEEKEAISKAINAVTMLKIRRLKARTVDLYNSMTKEHLSALYPKEEKKEE
jgi:hypothetical protein